MNDIQRLLDLKENFSSTNRPIGELFDEMYNELILLKKEQIAQKEQLDRIEREGSQKNPMYPPYVVTCMDTAPVYKPY